jgi:hypothetical protein
MALPTTVEALQIFLL